MNKSKIICVLVLTALLGLSQAKSNLRGSPTLDLDDYIDTPNRKKEVLSASATGYYGHQFQPYHHDHAHHGGYQHIAHYAHAHHAPIGHYHHHPHGYSNAQTYFVGEYGLGHVGSAHVSYGTEINHGHSHQHHHSHGYYG